MTLNANFRKTSRYFWQVELARAGTSSIWPLAQQVVRFKSDAEEWARSIEHKLDIGNHVPSSQARKHTLAEAIDRYLEVVLPRAARRKNAREQTRILNWWREQLGDRHLTAITTSVVAEVRDAMAARTSRFGTPVTGGTINRHLAALSGLLKFTVREFGWLSKNPVANVSKFAESKGRERFLSETECERLLRACGASACAHQGYPPLSANTSAVVVRKLTIPAGHKLTIGAGARLKIG